MELTQLTWAGVELRLLGPVVLAVDDIVAQFETCRCSVVYLRAGGKLLVRESLSEVERQCALVDTEREVLKRFKREMRECKAVGISIDHAFADLWEDVSSSVQLSEREQAALYQVLVDWTKRWLK